jgi:hypothetical protein
MRPGSTAGARTYKMRQIIRAAAMLKRGVLRVMPPALAVSAVLGATLVVPSLTNVLGIRSAYPPPSCTSASVSAYPSSPKLPATPVTLTATSTGCTPAQYKFWMLAPGGSWTAQSTYGGDTFTWRTAGSPPGVYQVGVWARQVTSTAPYEAYFIGTYTLLSPYCTAATISASLASPQTAGTKITFTANPTGCGTPLFEFWELPRGRTGWVSLGPYSGNPSVDWFASAAPGAYRFGVWVKESGSPHSYDSYGIMTFWVN